MPGARRLISCWLLSIYDVGTVTDDDVSFSLSKHLCRAVSRICLHTNVEAFA